MFTIFCPRSGFPLVIEVVVERSFNRVSTRYLDWWGHARRYVLEFVRVDAGTNKVQTQE